MSWNHRMKKITDRLFVSIYKGIARVTIGLLTLFLLTEVNASQQGSAEKPVLDERCIINILNGSTRIAEDGNFALLTPLTTDVPYRARAICNYDGELVYGESSLLHAVSGDDGIDVGEILFDQYHPIPISLSLDVASQSLNINQPVAQLRVSASLPGGISSELTLGSQGTVYSTSSSVVSVSEDGLVTAQRTGQAIVSVRHEGVMASLVFDVYFPLDSDNDGLTDEFELNNALDPNDASDALGDKDADGLSNLEEYLLGTSVLHQDTDGDTISDFDETQIGTDPLQADTDADGMVDGEELLRGTDPLSGDSDNDGISDSVEVQFGLNPLVFTDTTRIVGEVVNLDNNPVVGASAVVFNSFSAVTNQQGQFEINHVPVIKGDIIVSVRSVFDGRIFDGNSDAFAPVALQTIDVGEVLVEEIVGELFGEVISPRGERVSGARITVTYSSGEEWSTNSDVQGIYQLNNLPEGNVQVVAQDPRTGLYGVSTGQLRADSNLELDIKLKAFGTIRGKAYFQDAQTAVLEGTKITIARVGGGYTGETQANAFGEFKFDFVPLGEYRIESFGQGLNRGLTNTVLSGTTQVHDADIVFLPIGRVSGFVETATGSRLTGVEVRLYSTGVYSSNYDVVTNSSGEFTFEQVYAGSFYLNAVDSSRNLSGKSQGIIDQHQQIINLPVTMMPTGSVQGLVLKSTGQTVEGAKVTIAGREAITDAGGNYSIPYLSLGIHNLVVSTNEGDYAKGSVEITVADQLLDKNITLNGLANATVTIVTSQGKVVSNTQVTLTIEKPYRRAYVLNTNEQGQVQFNNVLAGQAKISVFDPIAKLGGSLSTVIVAGEDATATVTLEDAGDILGTVYLNDGVTVAPHVSVVLKPLGLTTTTGSMGRFQFNTLPLSQSPYVIKVLDAEEIERAKSVELNLATDGEKIQQDLIMKGNGAITGIVYDPSGLPAAGATVKLTSKIEGARKRTIATNSSGRYTFIDVPQASFTISASNLAKRQAAGTSGVVLEDGQLLTIDLPMMADELPAGVKTVAQLFDANAFAYTVQRDGSIKEGSFNVFAGDKGNNSRALMLKLVRDDIEYPFIGSSVTVEQAGREVIVKENLEAGVSVERKIFVPADGYFTRYIETLENSSDEDVELDLVLSSHFSISTYIRTINGVRRSVSVPLDVVTSSSGDNFFNVSAGEPDRWLLVDDDLDNDPFESANAPSLSFLFNGETNPTQLTDGEFLSGSNGAYTRLKQTWHLTIAAQSKVSLMHFVSQQTDRAAATSAINRLEQLPPEAIVGLSEEEKSSIQNFDFINDDGGLSALPSAATNLFGNLYEFDNLTEVKNSKIQLKSLSPLFQRTYNSETDINGTFDLVTNLINSPNNIFFPDFGYQVSAIHPQTEVIAEKVVEQFSPTVDVIFNNTGRILGTVRRYDGVVASFGKIELVASHLNKTLSVSIPEDGQYQFNGLPAGDYRLIASLPSPDGTDIGGSLNVNLTNETSLVRDVVLTQVGGIIGQVTNGAGVAKAGIEIRITAPGFVRETHTDTGGVYKFLDMPLGDYTLTMRNPRLAISEQRSINVADESVITENFQLTEIGRVNLTVTYESGAVVGEARLYLQREILGDEFASAGHTNSLGKKSFLDVPQGNYSIKAYNPRNNNLVEVISGSILVHAEVDNLTLVIPEDTAPTITLTAPILGSQFIKGQTIDVSAEVEDDYGINRVEFYLNDVRLAADYVAPYQQPLVLNSDIENSVLKVIVIDQGANSSSASTTIVVKDDQQAPTISFLSPQVGYQFLEGSYVHIAASAEDDIAIKQVEFYVDDERVFVDLKPPYSHSYLIAKNYTDTNDDAQLNLKVVAKDFNDNSSEQSLNFGILKDELPQVNFTTGSPSANSEFVEGSVINVAVAAVDDVNISKVELYADGQLLQTRFSQPFVFTFTAPDLKNIQNPLSLTARAYDTKGQSQTSEPLDVIIIKNEAPTISWNSPTTGSHFVEGQIIPLSVTAADDIALDKVLFYVDEQLVGSQTSAPFEMSFQLSSGEQDSTLLLKAIALDSFGQEASETIEIVREDDLVAPSNIEFTAPANDSIISVGPSDVVIVIDTSYNTRYSSGADVDGDNVNDSVLKAEVFAAKQMLDLLNPITTRVAIVDSSSYAYLIQSLTSDFDSVKTKLDEVLASGSSGYSRYAHSLQISTDELVGIRSRSYATAVQILLANGTSALPDVELERAVNAGVIVNTFAIGQSASTSVLRQIAERTGGVITPIPDVSKIASILSTTVLFGLDSLIAIAEANDETAIKQVTMTASSADGAVNSSRSDNQAPFTLAASLPEINDTLEINLTAEVEDFGGNKLQLSAIKVTLLPAKNTPVLVKANPEYAATGSLVSVLGKFLVASGSQQPSTEAPEVFATNQLFLNGVKVTTVNMDKSKIVFALPVDTVSGELYAIVDGVQTNTINFYVDDDQDGLSNEQEAELGTDPNKADSDDDGLLDGEEVNQYNTDPFKADSDDDGISDSIEINKQLDPNDASDATADNDDDGLTNIEEIAANTDLNNSDSDNDGLTDGAEVKLHNTNPKHYDSDRDGLSDRQEVEDSLSDPNKTDTDGDTLNDYIEFSYGLDPNDATDALADNDDDGLTNLQELITYYTSISESDTDNDGLSDYDEVMVYNTKPRSLDSDYDGENDGLEVTQGTDPNDRNSSLTVSFTYSLSDGVLSWTVYNSGHSKAYLAYQELAELRVNGTKFYDLDNRAVKDGSEQHILQNTVAGLDVKRKIFVPQGQRFIRYLETFTNSTLNTIDADVKLRSRLVYSNKPIQKTSSGDALLDENDTYVLIDDGSSGGNQAAVAQVWGNLDSQLLPSLTEYTNQRDVAFTYSLQVAPGQTIALLHFATADSLLANTEQKLQILEALPVETLQQISNQDFDVIANFDMDTDDDGLSDQHEESIGTAIDNPDTDGDGFSDKYEVDYGLDPLVADTDVNSDEDNDGLSLAEEALLGTNPKIADTDGDGIEDGDEATYNTDPLRADTDRDGLTDGAEVNEHSTDPAKADSDDDGLSDGVEINQHQTDPNLADSDSDTISDGDEIEFGLDPKDASDALLDIDNDGLNAAQEVAAGTKINRYDTDYDGESDGFEVEQGTDPTDPASSTTVALYHSVPDFSDTYFSLGNSGISHNYAYDNGLKLVVDDTQFYDDDYRARRLGADQYVLSNILPDVTVARYFYFEPEHKVIRVMEALTNTSLQVHTYDVQLISDMYYTPGVVSTSSGDAIIDNADFSVLLDDNDESSESGLKAVAELWGNQSGGLAANSVTHSNDDLVMSYQLTLQPGETQVLMHFSVASYDRAETVEKLTALIDLPDYSQQASGQLLDKVINFDLDTDNDGLADYRETQLGTDINDVDSDDDGLSDKYEVYNNLNPNQADDLTSDLDGDGLTLQQEHDLGTNPSLADTDDDGLSDKEETEQATDPLKADSDGDGLLDGAEVNEHQTDPNSTDSDGDSLTDAQEVNDYQTNPNLADSDADGIDDAVEINNGLNPNDDSDALLDEDNDGLNTKQELDAGTNRNNPDSDYDGLQDGAEVNLHGTDPTNFDTDQDGENDGQEIEFGSDPLDPNSTASVGFPFTLTDGSGFDWNILFGGVASQFVAETGGESDFGPDEFSGLYYGIDTDRFSAGNRAKKLTDRSIEVVARENVEIPLPVKMSREIYVAENEGFIRYLEKLHNTSEQTINYRVMIADILSSQSSPATTSSGDAEFTVEDRYMISGQLGQIDKVVGHMWSNSDTAKQTDGYLVQGPAVGYFFDLVLLPGQQVSLLHYGVQATTAANAIIALESMQTVSPEMLAGLTVAQQEKIINLNLDSDNDGLIDAKEAELGTQADNSDSDGDGLGDGFEHRYGFDPLTAGEEGLDGDLDTLTNLQEFNFGSNPLEIDTDSDGLTDKEEFDLSTNPNSSDTDQDGLSDIYERDTSSTNPSLADSDADGINDGDEINQTSTDPLKADTDEDGIKDGVEVAAHLDPNSAADAALDADSDSLTNLQEAQLGTAINNPDTDSDGLGDADEVNTHNTNPLSNDTDSDGLLDKFELDYSFNPLLAGEQLLDPDLDNLSNIEEQKRRTQPNKADTDEDGVNDDLDKAPLDPSRSELAGVLLVDDINGGTDIAVYQAALDAANISYETMYLGGELVPTREQMAAKSLVLWVTGPWGGLSSYEDELFSSYLNGGGCGFLTSQVLLLDRSVTPLLDEFMGLDSAVPGGLSGSGNMQITGAGSLYPISKTYDLTFDFYNYASSVEVDSEAEALFTVNGKAAASYYDSGKHLGVFLPFALEAVTDVDDRAEIINKVYQQCIYTHDVNVEYIPPPFNGGGGPPV